MTKENFAEELRNRLPEYMPDRCKNLRFCIKKINKNNGVELTGILKFYAKTTTSGIDIGYKEGLKKICESPHTIKEYGFTAKFIKVARLVI